MRGNGRSELKEIHNCASQRLCLMKNGSEPSGDLFKEDVLPYSCNPRDTVSSLQTDGLSQKREELQTWHWNINRLFFNKVEGSMITCDWTLYKTFKVDLKLKQVYFGNFFKFHHHVSSE